MCNVSVLEINILTLLMITCDMLNARALNSSLLRILCTQITDLCKVSVLLFGLCNAPATFKHLMWTVLAWITVELSTLNLFFGSKIRKEICIPLKYINLFVKLLTSFAIGISMTLI